MTDQSEIEKEQLPTTFRDKLPEMLTGKKFEDDIAEMGAAVNLDTWTKREDSLEAKKAHYMRTIETSFNNDVPKLEDLKKDYYELKKHEKYHCESASFFVDCMKLVESANQRLSTSLQYTAVLSQDRDVKSKFISDALRDGLQKKITEDEKRELNRKASEVIVGVKRLNPDFSMEALNEEVKATTQKIEQKQAEITAKQLTLERQQDFVRVDTLGKIIGRLEAQLSRAPNFTEISKEWPYGQNELGRFLNMGRDMHFFKLTHVGNQKRYSKLKEVAIQDFAINTEEIATKALPNMPVAVKNGPEGSQNEKKHAKIAQTEGVMDEEVEGNVDELSQP